MSMTWWRRSGASLKSTGDDEASVRHRCGHGGALYPVSAPRFGRFTYKAGFAGTGFFQAGANRQKLSSFLDLQVRTMVQDASTHGGLITVGEDRRITRVGRILRKTKVDEIPQLINIIKGEMAIVGPRPEIRHY